MNSDALEVLGNDVTRLLSDKLYDKRKQAANIIETQVKDALAQDRGGGTAGARKVRQILECLRRDYVDSTVSNHRKGGLFGLASVAIGLDEEAAKFLDYLVKPVLEKFEDDDPRVRYYACEALYNIAKVADEAVLLHFNEVFDGLCKLYADVDSEVKNGVQILDRLMKDVVTQHASSFRAADFIPLLSRLMRHLNPFIRQLVLAWISLLLTLHEIDMVGYLPQYIEALFNMLGDQSRDIKHNADACLHELQKGVTSAPHEKALHIIAETTRDVVKCCTAADNSCRLTAVCWLHEFVVLQTEAMKEGGQQPAESWVALLPDLLSGTLHCIDDAEEEIAKMAVEQHSKLLVMVENLTGNIAVDQLVGKLLVSMQTNVSVKVRTACLQWICMLLQRSPEQMLQRSTLHKILDPIFDTLQNPEDEVVAAALLVLAQIMKGRTASVDEAVGDEKDGKEPATDLFTTTTHRLLRLFETHRQMLEGRRRLSIRQLSSHVDPRLLYVTVARAIQQEVTDVIFAQQLVQTFSWILLTAPETKPLREELLATPPLLELPSSGTAPPPGASLFVELLEPWFRNPVSALALCLWSQQYELAVELTARFAAFEPTLDILRQLDQLVHLLESPVFARLRLQLLEPRKHPALLKCLLGLAMLLPQAGAFNILRERVRVVQGGLLLETTAPASQEGDRGGRLWWPTVGAKEGDGGNDIAGLLDRFDDMLRTFQ